MNLKPAIVATIIAAVLTIGFFALNSYIYDEKQAYVASDHKNAEYIINGKRVRLKDGVSDTRSGPGLDARVVTKYFGDELVVDLDGDGDQDVAFIVTQSTGGSGTFYYAVAALDTGDGFVGSNGYLLGDRIAPQSVELSRDPRHAKVVIFNYADREPSEPMAAQPSVGRSVYLKIVPEFFQWAVVEPDFEGESVI